MTANNNQFDNFAGIANIKSIISQLSLKFGKIG